MRFADVDNVFDIVEADAEVLTCRLILDAQMIDEVLHGIDKCGLTIATTASQQARDCSCQTCHKASGQHLQLVYATHYHSEMDGCDIPLLPR